MFCATGTVQAQVAIVGHRGGLYAPYPESSIKLFNATAASFGKDTVCIEIDLRKSKDGSLYLMHDPTVDRTTTGTGQLEERSDQYLNALRLKTKDGKITDEHIPSFDEVLTFISNRNINLMLDIKAPVHKEALEQVKRHNMENRMLVLTFKDEFTRLVAETNQNVLLSALIETEQAWKAFEQIPVRPGKRIAYITAKTPAELITRLRQQKVRIMADVSEDSKNGGKPLSADGYRTKVKNQQLDILISDFPTEAHHALGSQKRAAE
ncbi:glycerophosphodiester phosphodiesterase family protein [Dyadobacter flavalbus]|nr:glycerophosphodiester phosphodiesterase family protein [Dyadobacter flavalbus]